MPELPEVESVKIGLNQLVSGKTIEEVQVFWPSIVESPEVEKFCCQLVGETIEFISRRGKFLIFHLTHLELISHLRMEGKYEFYTSAPENRSKHAHVRFLFTDGTLLEYQDVRKFGRMALVEKNQAVHYRGIVKLGPEPIPDKFLLSSFRKSLKKHHKAIKPLLLDQTLVTGLGNIYVDEALYQAKIHPEQSADSLTDTEVEKLHDAIIGVLARAVEAGGTTVRTYKNALGEAGKFQVQLKVYGQTGQPCDRCGTPIQKIKVSQRGTHFCPNCQQLHS